MIYNIKKIIEFILFIYIIMFTPYNMKNYNKIIDKKRSLNIWKYQFNKKWNLPVIHEEGILHISYIIENYF